jgi:hypothetical protein
MDVRPRRVGLSRTQAPDQLLKMVPRQPKEKLEEDDITRPPESTDEDSDAEATQWEAELVKDSCPGLHYRSGADTASTKISKYATIGRKSAKQAAMVDIDSSPEAVSSKRRGDIPSTRFETKKQPDQSKASPVRRSARQCRDTVSEDPKSSATTSRRNSRKQQTRSRDEISDGDEPTMLNDSKRSRTYPKTTPFPESIDFPRQPKRNKTMYGAKSSQSQSRKSKETQSPTPEAESPDEASLERPIFKKLALSVSPESPKNSALGFIAPILSPPSNTPKATRFKNILGDYANSLADATADTRPTFKRYASDVDLSPNRPSNDRYKGAAKANLERIKRKRAIEEFSLPAAPVFKLPGDKADFGGESQMANDDSSALLIDDTDEPETPVKAVHISDSAAPSCPICGEVVEKSLLDNFSKGKWKGTQMPVAVQDMICRSHKMVSAKASWAENAYPTINWDVLETRLNAHRPLLSQILDGKPSYYRDILAKKIKAGQDRTLLTSKRVDLPGYYGPRGLRAIQEYVITNFGSHVRSRAARDPTISKRGYGHYVQAVLVPELAVRLIMDDMGVSVEMARTIMEESVGLGELLSEDVPDTVVTRSDDEL